MTPSKLQKKLRVLAGQRILIAQAPDGFLESLGSLPDGCTVSSAARGHFDHVHLFVKNSSELEKHLGRVRKGLKYDGVFWISYPKQSAKTETDLNRDILWGLLAAQGLRAVTMVSVDETWSAMRFRPDETAGKVK
jgi:hypothetical protein